MSMRRPHESWPERIIKHVAVATCFFSAFAALPSNRSTDLDAIATRPHLCFLAGLGMLAVIYLRQIGRELRGLRYDAGPAIEVLKQVKKK